ncbi:AraC family transcriptional regulator [Pseudonocardia alni]|uniref:AraC family transcriptional regulator n=1 Tax=Pseudonocardia alni TaxID=33907 RepID=UPI00280C1B1A|nr:helix-turn-helix transcriptional regulator [Pseudonocardia alni]
MTDDSAVCEPMGHGEGVAEHLHDFGQLRYAVRGVLVTVTDAGTWMAPANRITWVPPFHVHSSRAHGDTDVRLLNVAAAQAERLPADAAVVVARPLLREAFLALVDEPAGTARAELMQEVVTTEIARAPRESLRLPEPSDARLLAVTTLLHSDPAEPATLAELGHRTGASERTLSRLFSSELSMSFQQWRTLLRVQRALLELGDGVSVTDTAIRLGWANPSNFIEAFTELIGETPGRYRTASRV